MSIRLSLLIGGSVLVLLCGHAGAQQNSRAAPDPRQRQTSLERIDPAKRTDPQRIELARAYYQAGRLDEAFQQAAVVSKRRPDSAEVWLIQGDVWRERKQWQRALDAFSRAAKLSPNRAEIELRRGQALMELGKTGEADAAFARYQALNQAQSVHVENK